MPFNSAITNQTARRASGYQARQFIIACPNEQVFQCQPSANSSAPTYASFGYTNVTIGAYTDVKEGQTVIISSDAGLTDILFRGRVRKVPTASTFYINQTSFALLTTHYVTVIDSYDLVERLEFIDTGGAIFKDYDLTYQNLPPVITNLQSSYVLPTTSSTASQAFAPTAQAMASGATVASWLWDVADGTITVGTSTSQNITVSFPAGYRWVVLKVTDSNSVTTRYCFEVWVGNPDAASEGQLLRAEEGASITGTWEDGWNASIEWFAGLAGLLPGTRITIWSEHWFGNGTTSTTVDFVGYLQDDRATLTGDENYGQVKTSALQAYGFASLLGRLKSPSALVTAKASPSAWGDIKDPTPARVLTYALAWHTTAFNLCSFQWASDDGSYVSDDITLEQYQALEAVNDFLSRYNAEATFSPSGEIRGARNGCYLSDTARNALTTVTTLTTADILSASIETRYTVPVGSVIMPAISFDTTSDDVRAYIGKAPAVTALYSGEEQTGPRQVLTANATDSAARSELAGRTANHFAYINRLTTLTLDLIDSYSDLVPTNNQWFVLQLSAADNPSGRAFTTERWQLISINTDAVSPDGVRTVSATFQLETQDTGAQILITLIPPQSAVSAPAIPVVGPYDFDTPWLSPDTTPPDFNYSPLSQDANRGIPPGGRQPQDSGCELLRVPMWTGTPGATTSFNTVAGKTYTIVVEGSAQKPAATSWSYTWDFTSSNGNWITSGGAATYVLGTGWQGTGTLNSRISFPLGAGVQVDGFSVVYENAAGQNGALIDENASGSPTGTNFVFVTGLAASGTFAYPGGTVTTVWDSIIVNSGGIASFTIYKSVTISGPGTPPLSLSGGTLTTFSDATVLDAFYTQNAVSGEAVLLPAGRGLRRDATAVVAPAGFTDTHAYGFTVTGDGQPWTFDYNLPDYTDVPRVFLFVNVCPREVV